MHEETHVPFQSVYVVTVSDPVKSGDVVQYTVNTTERSNGSEFTVTRLYDDFDYLQHCLLTENPQHGIIVSILTTDMSTGGGLQ